MTRIRRPALAVATVALSALVLAGCTVTGGGFMPSTNYAKKATFGFTVTNEPGEDSVLKGFWNDGSKKFTFISGGFDFISSGGCTPISGTYQSTVKPSKGLQGSFSLTVCDEGEPGVSSGDTIDLDLTSGPFSGYSNSGPIQGGNVQLKIAKDDGP